MKEQSEETAAEMLQKVKDAEAIRDHFLVGWTAQFVKTDFVSFVVSTRRQVATQVMDAHLRLDINGRVQNLVVPLDEFVAPLGPDEWIKYVAKEVASVLTGHVAAAMIMESSKVLNVR